MSNKEHIEPQPVTVALFKYSDKPAWQLALEILEKANISMVCNGGMGVFEISVAANQAELALILLKKESGLAGKLLSLDELRGPRTSN